MSPEILSQLKDVHLPKAPSWWPPAPGYYVIFFVLLASILIAWYYYHKKKPVWALKKQINSELRAFEQSFSRSGDIKALQSNLAQLLRRVLHTMDPKLQSRNIELIDLCPSLEKLWGASHTRELVGLLEQDRFKKVNTLDGSRLIFLANKKFKQCKL